ncbi:MAG: FHA domain-containing protein [Lachnospiraceae bacterium]|nr:FHA domain-containing protein [Lachnospiraceae bacterium]
MNKIKTQKKAGQSLIIINSLKGQQLQKNEIYAINTAVVRGLVHMGVDEKKNAFQLTYNVTGLIPMKEYLATPLNRERFTQILQSILANLKSMEQAYFNRQQLLMEFDRVLVNPATQQICFIYVPIQYFDGGTSLREFLMSIIQYASFTQGEDTAYVQDYIKILNNGLNFSMFDLEQYVNKLLGQEGEEQQTIMCPTCKTQHRKRTKFCNVCGTALVEEEDRDESKTYTPPIREEFYTPTPAAEVYTPTPVAPTPVAEVYTPTQVVYSPTPVAEVIAPQAMPPSPYLMRRKNSEIITFTKIPFRIGKGADLCDYCVSDNNAISRQHVDFYVENGRCFVVDLASTNKTYINNAVISQHAKYEVFVGDVVRLANEEFVVQ